MGSVSNHLSFPLVLLYSSLEDPGGILLGTARNFAIFPAAHRVTCFLMIFRHRFGTPFFRILVPTWPQLGPQLGPKIDQKSIQEPSKIHPNLHLVFDPLLDRFLIDFWSIFDPQIDQKSIKNRPTNHPNNTTTKN